MIDVAAALRSMPAFEKFCSVAQMQSFVEELRADSRFEVTVAGTSRNGIPIHHVRFGQGALKALFVGFPHPNEPIGGLTVLALMNLLKEGHPTVIGADVEWHIIPCSDPDGAVLNEGWTQPSMTLGRPWI